MSRELRIAVDIQSTPDRVWEVLRDVERWPEWTASVTSIERTDRGPFTVGSRVKIRQPKLRPAEWQVTEFDQAKGIFNWVSRSPGLQITGGHRLERVGAGTRATLTVEFAGFLGPLLALLYNKLNRRYVGMEAEGLRQRSENLNLPRQSQHTP